MTDVHTLPIRISLHSLARIRDVFCSILHEEQEKHLLPDLIRDTIINQLEVILTRFDEVLQLNPIFNQLFNDIIVNLNKTDETIPMNTAASIEQQHHIYLPMSSDEIVFAVDLLTGYHKTCSTIPTDTDKDIISMQVIQDDILDFVQQIVDYLVDNVKK